MPPNKLSSSPSMNIMLEQLEVQQTEQVDDLEFLEFLDDLEILRKVQLLIKEQLQINIQLMEEIIKELKKQPEQNKEQLNKLNIQLEKYIKIYASMKENCPEAIHRRLNQLLEQEHYQQFRTESREAQDQALIYDEELSIQNEELSRIFDYQQDCKMKNFLKKALFLALISLFCLAINVILEGELN